MQNESLNYRIAGAANGPTLALLHGFMSCNAQWLANEAVLGAHYRLVMIELWGHGNSPAPTDPAAYSIERYIDEFESIREHVGAVQWLLFGQSYGAGLMLNYAMHHPEHCPAVVTTNSRSAYGPVTRAPRRRDRPDPLDDPDFSLRRLPYHPVNARRFPEHIKQAMVANADAMQRHVVKLGGRLGAQLCFRDRMDQVPVPVMIGNGVYEKSFQDDIEHLQSHFDNLHIVPLEGGHSVNIEDADGFNAAVLDFLARAGTLPKPTRR